MMYGHTYIKVTHLGSRETELETCP